MIYSSSKNFQPELRHNSEQKADEMHVSPAIAKPFVCVQRSCQCDESRSLDGRRGATFTIKPVACCVPISWEVVNDATGESVRVERTVKRL